MFILLLVIAWCVFWGTLLYLTEHPMPMIKFIALQIGIVITSLLILCIVMYTTDFLLRS
jgi:hypothetical protein